ncbi:lipid A export permease/ATP-binding protein MsbA [Rhodoferax sp.]|uniref:lipid A export permease/ATP-binding protein MsbA n=1 Tax=Rhodoferax sp. TaxID=50421 RepID=UPI002848AB02|nr:lipid A export permease/ATP-binding protein MsbA [Rhodoferax sp.]MDR3370196.1 lipid A export permease/ATP-binding protein MsbA [Rhodoferax sp.]
MSPTALIQRFQRVFPHFKRPLYAWLTSGVAVLVSSALEPTIPALLKPLLDSGFSSRTMPPWLVPIVLIGIFSLRSLASFVADVSLAKVAQTSLHALRTRMFAKVTLAELELYRLQPATALANTLVYETNIGAILLLQSVTTIVKDSVTIIALLGYLLFLNWKLTLIVACLFPVIAISMRVLAKRLYRLTKDAQSEVDRLAYVVEESVLAHKEIRIQGAQAQQTERFAKVNEQIMRIAMKSAMAGSAVTPMTQIFASVALSAVITIALFQTDAHALTAGGFMAFITAMLMLIAPIKHLSEVASTVTRGLVAMERALNLIETVKDEESGAFNIDRCSGAIQLNHVQVTYPNADAPALNDICLSVKPGEFVALIGLSGSGKSTLAQLLTRFVNYDKGHVYLDGIELSEWNIQSLRRQFAFVGQSVIMLNDSVLNNIVLGQPLDRARAQECVEAANLKTFIDSLPQGIDTPVGHNASLLSGGERQRLAIARAMYKNAPILILDEVTSALDTDTERLVQDALRKIMIGRTTIAIAHRLSTVKDADKIVVLQAGRIVQTGTHQTLENVEGPYQDFRRLSQF